MTANSTGDATTGSGTFTCVYPSGTCRGQATVEANRSESGIVQ
jgi:hypothetical protein